MLRPSRWPKMPWKPTTPQPRVLTSWLRSQIPAMPSNRTVKQKPPMFFLRENGGFLDGWNKHRKKRVCKIFKNSSKKTMLCFFLVNIFIWFCFIFLVEVIFLLCHGFPFGPPSWRLALDESTFGGGMFHPVGWLENPPFLVRKFKKTWQKWLCGIFWNQLLTIGLGRVIFGTSFPA